MIGFLKRDFASARRMCVLGVACLVLASRPALAADDEALVRLLAKADLAHNFAFYCAQFDPSIIEATKSTVGDIQALMQHIRGEVVSGLPQPEAFQIVVRSANAARAGALLAVRKLYGPNREEERARLTEWCRKSVLPSLREFIALHDGNHAVLDKAIQRAKQGGVQKNP